MLEKDRATRNQQMLVEMYPTFQTRAQAVLKELEGYGLRPRIQEAWRSPQDQMDAYRSGHSQLMYGFHNVTAADGTKEALAADIIDDNNPTSLNLPFVLHLLAAAENNGLTTGVYWNLSVEKVAAIHAAIAAKDWNAKIYVGWDPLHVEVEGITTQEAKAGKRPYVETPNPDDNTDGIGFKVTRKVRGKIASLNVRSGPGLNNPIVSSLKMGQVVEITREVSGWGQISDGNQWISLAYVAPADVPVG